MLLSATRYAHGHVLYGGYTFTILIRGARPQVAVMDACINQRNTGRLPRLSNREEEKMPTARTHHEPLGDQAYLRRMSQLLGTHSEEESGTRGRAPADAGRRFRCP